MLAALLKPSRLGRPALGLLALAAIAVAVAVAGFEHARLDRIDDDADDVAESIVEPGDDIVDGYSSELMPSDFGERLSSNEVRPLAVFIAAASGSDDEDGDNSGRGGGDGDSGSGGGDDDSGG